VLLVLFTVTLACGPKSEPPGQMPEPPEPTSTDTPPPPPPATETTTSTPEVSGAGREELESIPPPPPVRPEAEGWSEESPPPVPEQAPPATYGYRVQVFASATRDGAERVAAEVRGELQESVAIEYQAPFYKVRVGNCVTRHEAERLRERVLETGREGAFIVETMVDAR
jgi:cell division protein FtsN